MGDLPILSITELTFDGTLLMRDDLTVLLALKRGIGEVPTVRGVDTIVPHLAGRIATSRVGDRMALELEGYVLGVAADDAAPGAESIVYYDRVREMRTLFGPTKAPALLSGVLPDGTIASILARATPPLLWNEELRGVRAKLNVALESVAPDWTFTPGGS